MKRKSRNRWLSTAVNVGIIVVGLTAVSFLPPDTSLKERRDSGILKLCVPPSFPPLVTGDPEAPGYDIELMQAVAKGMGLRLVVNTMATIGGDYNPRNWMLTRAQCDVIAGGVADTPQTRSFLQTIPTDAASGWVLVTKGGEIPPEGSAVVVLPGSSGLDRIAMSSWMRENKWNPKPARSVADFERELVAGDSMSGITERFIASTSDVIAQGYSLFWLPEQTFQQNAMAVGLWKGDQTLKSGIFHSLSEFKATSGYEALRQRYHVGEKIPVL